MTKFSWRGPALVLSAGAVALAGAIPAQAATNPPGWRIYNTYSASSAATLLTGVDAVSAGDAWSIGVSAKTTGTAAPVSVIRHWTGKAWDQVTLPSKIAKKWDEQDPVYATVGASSSTNVFAFSEFPGGAYLRLSGKTWSTGTLPGNNLSAGTEVMLTSAEVFTTHNVWAFGATVNLAATTPTEVPYVAHFNGSKWTAQALPPSVSSLQGGIASVSAASAGSIWAVIGDPSTEFSLGLVSSSAQAVLHWTSAGWTAVPAPASFNLGSVLAQGSSVWVGGSVSDNVKGGTNPAIAKLTSTAGTWTVTDLKAINTSAKWQLTEMASDGHGGIWGVVSASNRGTESLWHLQGAKWSQVTPNFGKHTWLLAQLAAVPRTTSVWGAGASRRGSGADGIIALAGSTPR